MKKKLILLLKSFITKTFLPRGFYFEDIAPYLNLSSEKELCFYFLGNNPSSFDLFEKRLQQSSACAIILNKNHNLKLILPISSSLQRTGWNLKKFFAIRFIRFH